LLVSEKPWTFARDLISVNDLVKAFTNLKSWKRSRARMRAQMTNQQSIRLSYQHILGIVNEVADSGVDRASTNRRLSRRKLES